jgi:hypothetical protein
MSLDKLRATLAELEAELQQADALDPDSRARLEQVAKDISAALHRSDPTLPDLKLEPPHTFSEQLTDSVESFRAQYPTLAGVVQRLTDGLAQLGI